MSKYALVKDGVIQGMVLHPQWRNEAGELLPDEALVRYGYFPVVFNPPVYDPKTHTLQMEDQTHWVIESDCVRATYRLTPIPFEELRFNALDRINRAYSERTQTLAQGYPEDEQKSWPVQILEAEVVLVGDEETPTPWIDSAAQARNVTRQELAELIKAQDLAYRNYHGQLTGIRQALRDQIHKVPDDENASAAFDAIQWPA